MTLSQREQDRISRLITEVSAGGTRLTKWEEEFIYDLELQFKEKRWVSEKQADILERIHTEKV